MGGYSAECEEWVKKESANTVGSKNMMVMG